MSWYDTKQPDGEALVLQEFWVMQGIPSLAWLSGSSWSGEIVSDRIQSMGQVKLNCVLMQNLFVRNRNVYMYKNAFGII